MAMKPFPVLILAALALVRCGGSSETLDDAQDDGMPESIDAPDLSEDAGFDPLPDSVPDLPVETADEDLAHDPPVDVTPDEGIVDETGLLVWYLDGVETARSHGAEAGSTYLFLPYWGRNVQVYFTDNLTLPTGTYGCADFMSGPVSVSLITVDNTWAGLESLPERWKNLNIAYCNSTGTYPDSVDMQVRFDETGPHLRGAYGCTITGAAERAGETLTIEGTFSIDVP
jgi:hypothetical protein